MSDFKMPLEAQRIDLDGQLYRWTIKTSGEEY